MGRKRKSSSSSDSDSDDGKWSFKGGAAGWTNWGGGWGGGGAPGTKYWRRKKGSRIQEYSVTTSPAMGAAPMMTMTPVMGATVQPQATTVVDAFGGATTVIDNAVVPTMTMAPTMTMGCAPMGPMMSPRMAGWGGPMPGYSQRYYRKGKK